MSAAVRRMVSAAVRCVVRSTHTKAKVRGASVSVQTLC